MATASSSSGTSSVPPASTLMPSPSPSPAAATTLSPFPPGITPPAPPTTKQDHDTSSLVNLYFLILAFGVFILVIIYWFIHRQRREQRLLSVRRRQTALERDMQGWRGNRTWMYGGWRSSAGHGMHRKEEGLDEHGMAPPPYEPSTAESTRGLASDQHDIERQARATFGSHEAANNLAVPMRTLSRASTRKPPGYEESISSASSSRVNMLPEHDGRPV